MQCDPSVSRSSSTFLYLLSCLSYHSGTENLWSGYFIKATIKKTVVDTLYASSVSPLLFAGNLVRRVEERLVCNSQLNFTCILCSTQRQSPILSQRFTLSIHNICDCLSICGIISFSVNSTGVYWVQLWSTLCTFSKNRWQEWKDAEHQVNVLLGATTSRGCQVGEGKLK